MLSTRGSPATRRAIARQRLPWPALGLVAVLACGEAPEAATPPLRIALPSGPVSLDPHFQDERITQAILANIYDGLTALDVDLRLRPSLAREWVQLDATSWRFELRRGVRFHDGSELGAVDVVASLERARHHPESKLGGYLVAIERVTALDPSTVEIVTSRPYLPLPAKLSFVPIVQATAPPRIERPVGSGPYRFTSIDASGIELAAFTDSWRGPPTWPRVRLGFDSKRSPAASLLAGEADLAGGLTQQDVALLAGSSEVTIKQRAGLAVTFLGMAVDRPPFSDQRLRTAIHLAIDRAAIVDQVLGGHAEPTWQLVSPLVVGYSHGSAPLEPRPEEARRLLEDAGLVGLAIELATPPTAAAEARALAAQLAGVGISTTVAERPWSELYESLAAGEVLFFLAGYACDSGSASDLFDATLHSPGALGYGETNFVGYRSAEVDALIEEANAASDMAVHRRLLEQIARRAMEDLPLVPLWSHVTLYAARRDLRWRPRADRRILAYEVAAR